METDGCVQKTSSAAFVKLLFSETLINVLVYPDPRFSPSYGELIRPNS